MTSYPPFCPLRSSCPSCEPRLQLCRLPRYAWSSGDSYGSGPSAASLTLSVVPVCITGTCLPRLTTIAHLFAATTHCCTFSKPWPPRLPSRRQQIFTCCSGEWWLHTLRKQSHCSTSSLLLHHHQTLRFMDVAQRLRLIWHIAEIGDSGAGERNSVRLSQA